MKRVLSLALLVVAIWGGYSYFWPQRRALLNPDAAHVPQNVSATLTTPKPQEVVTSSGPLPLTTDLSNGATRRITVARTLPELTLKFHPGSDRTPYQAVIETVEVFRGQDATPFQTLDDCAMDEPPYRDAEWMMAEDFNFDGYKDLEMLKWWGATGREGLCVWLFNPATGKFEYNEAFELGGKLALDTVRKVITVRDNERLAGAEYTRNTFAIVNNKPVLIGYEEQNCNPEDKSALRHTWYKPGRDGTLNETRSELIPDKQGMCASERSSGAPD